MTSLHRFPRRGCAALLLALAVPSAFSQEADSTVVPLGAVVVYGQRVPAARLAEELVPLTVALGAADLGELLSARHAVYLHAQGPGGAASPRVRGFDGSHTALLVDGVPLTHPHSGQLDLSAIPLSFLESAVLTRANSDGRGGLGGSVKLRTITSGEGLLLRARGGAGPFGITRHAVALGAGRAGREALVAFDASTAASGYPTHLGRREGAGGQRQSLLAKISARRRMTRLTGQYFLTDRTTALPGPSNGPPRRASLQDVLGQGVATFLTARPDLVVDGSVSMQSTASRFEDRDHDRSDRTETRQVRAQLQATHDAWQARASLTHAWLRGTTDSAGGSGGRAAETAAEIGLERSAKRGQWHGTVVLGTEVRAARLLTRPAARVSRGWGAVTAAFSLARASRYPTFVERFWQPGGNPTLRPERGWSAEGSLTWIPARAAVSLVITGFTAFLRDRIVWHPSLVAPGLQVWTPSNVGRARSRGLEARLQSGTAVLGFSASASLTHATDRTDPQAASYGHQLRYTPRVVAAGEAWVRLGQVDVTWSTQYTGRRPIASDGGHLEAAFAISSVSASTSRGPIHLAATLHNLLDASYEVVRLYPMPGRHATVRLHLIL